MIPSILWQTWKTSEVPRSVKVQADTWKQSNPQLELRFMDDVQCSEFIREHLGDSVYEKYQALPQPIMRADFWRLAVVYVYGGYYADLDITCNSHISTFVPENVDAVFMREVNNISNYFFGASPGHPAIKMAMDFMIDEFDIVMQRDTQSFGMHPLHHCVRTHYAVEDTNFISNDEVHFILDADVRGSGALIHSGASALGERDYESWRARNRVMLQEREATEDVHFVTTFNENGYDLYGRTWVKTFAMVANYYNAYRATVYYQGFEPDFSHPAINWIAYDDAIPQHDEWKLDYKRRTTHDMYVSAMCVRFSHKAFVMQHALDNINNRYVVWLDGDCVFKNADYTHWPSNIMNGNAIACQVEHAHDLNHVESGIIVFDTKHPDTKAWNEQFKWWYQVDNLLPMGQPYDGFVVSKALITSGIRYTDLNEHYGKGGIQSDPNMTFQHPEIKSKFIHNIGWTGKNQYENWDAVFQRDDIYQKVRAILFGNEEDTMRKKERAFSLLEEMRRLKA